MAVSHQDNMRVGSFILHEGVIDEHPEDVKRLMGTMIILRAEQMFHVKGIQYIAQCDQFDATEPGRFRLPEYKVWLEDGEWKTMRLDHLGEAPKITRVSTDAPKVCLIEEGEKK